MDANLTTRLKNILEKTFTVEVLYNEWILDSDSSVVFLRNRKGNRTVKENFLGQVACYLVS